MLAALDRTPEATSVHTRSTPGWPHSSTSRGQPGYIYHTTRTPVLSIADITGVPAGRGLYYGPGGWDLITLNPWWHQRRYVGL
jgi:hypothetical protein